METEIKPGDIVVLNSGGPDMTAGQIKDGSALCVWSNYESGGMESYWFPLPCLTKRPDAAVASAPTAAPAETIITFDAFVQSARDNGANIVNGMPWSFQFKGRPVTHENDACYLVMAEPGRDLRFTPDKVLVTCADGTLSLRPAS